MVKNCSGDSETSAPLVMTHHPAPPRRRPSAAAARRAPADRPRPRHRSRRSDWPGRNRPRTDARAPPRPPPHNRRCDMRGRGRPDERAVGRRQQRAPASGVSKPSNSPNAQQRPVALPRAGRQLGIERMARLIGEIARRMRARPPPPARIRSSAGTDLVELVARRSISTRLARRAAARPRRPAHRRTGSTSLPPLRLRRRRFVNPRPSHSRGIMRCVRSILLAAACSPRRARAQPIDPKVQARIDRILKATPLIDGHNDIAEQLARELQAAASTDLASGTDSMARQAADDRHGAAARRAASAGSSGRSISTARSPATRRSAETIEQIDIVDRMIAAYPQRPRARARPPTTSSASTRPGKIASLIGVEGGRQIGGIARRAAPILPARRALHDADPQPDHRMGRQRHRRSQI